MLGRHPRVRIPPPSACDHPCGPRGPEGPPIPPPPAAFLCHRRALMAEPGWGWHSDEEDTDPDARCALPSPFSGTPPYRGSFRCAGPSSFAQDELFRPHFSTSSLPAIDAFETAPPPSFCGIRYDMTSSGFFSSALSRIRPKNHGADFSLDCFVLWLQRTVHKHPVGLIFLSRGFSLVERQCPERLPVFRADTDALAPPRVSPSPPSPAGRRPTGRTQWTIRRSSRPLPGRRGGMGHNWVTAHREDFRWSQNDDNVLSTHGTPTTLENPENTTKWFAIHH